MWMGLCIGRLVGQIFFCRWDKYIEPWTWRDAAHLSEVSCENRLWGILLLVGKCGHGQKQLQVRQESTGGLVTIVQQWCKILCNLLWQPGSSPTSTNSLLECEVSDCVGFSWTYTLCTYTVPCRWRTIYAQFYSCVVPGQATVLCCLHRDQFGNHARKWLAVGKNKQTKSFQNKIHKNWWFVRKSEVWDHALYVYIHVCMWKVFALHAMTTVHHHQNLERLRSQKD